MDRSTLSTFVERTVDNEQSFSFRDILVRFYVRRWVLLICIVVMMIPTLGMTLLTPMTWVASTRILIRYSSTESAFLQDLIPDNRASLSGPVVGEILRSLPTLKDTVKRYDIQKSDIYQEPLRVVSGRIAQLISERSPDDEPPGSDAEVTRLAKMFQDSLQESSRNGSAALSARARPVELLGKDSAVPQSQRSDELITVTVRSFNRLKVAEMTNGLADTLIERYYQISAEDANRSYKFLSSLVKRAEEEVRALEADPFSQKPSPTLDAVLINRSAATLRDNPQTSKLTNELATLQTDLGRAQQFYRDDAPRIQRIQSEIAALKRVLIGQERLERARDVLQQTRARRFLALNTENLYRNRLLPISIVEPAVTPARSFSAIVSRLGVSAGTGALLGLVLGGALVTILGLMDGRLFTQAHVERELRLPIFGTLPRLRIPRTRRGSLPDADSMQLRNTPGLLHILARLDAAGVGQDGSSIAITSTSDGDGKSLVALLLARATAKAARRRVLLIDADPFQASISKHFGQTVAAGSADDAADTRPLLDMIVQTAVPKLDLLPAGSIAWHQNTGFYLARLRTLLDTARPLYDFVIVDAPSSEHSGEVLLCCVAVDNVLAVVRSGVTEASHLKGLLRLLHEVSVRPKGLILNFRDGMLPRFVDQGR